MKHDEILKRDYSDKFDELRKAAVIVSHYKYGAVEDNFGKYGGVCSGSDSVTRFIYCCAQ